MDFRIVLQVTFILFLFLYKIVLLHGTPNKYSSKSAQSYYYWYENMLNRNRTKMIPSCISGKEFEHYSI